jgi:S-layer homology domain
MMVEIKRSELAIALALTLLTGCAGNSALQKAFSADPKTGLWSSSASPTGSPTVEPPADFPAELRYQNATLQSASQTEDSQLAAIAGLPGTPTWQQTRWQTTEPAAQVKDFYTQQFQTQGWQLLPQSASSSQPDTLIARKADMQVVVVVPATSASSTDFSLSYAQTSAPPSASLNPSAVSTGQTPTQPGDPNFIGPVQPAGASSPNTPVNNSRPAQAQTFTDIDKAPAAFQTYIRDLAQLGVLTNSGSLFNPNQPINRRMFARWLVTTNNRIYSDRPARQIRLASSSNPPIFRDVPSRDPDFPYIQGLAEAGYLPSSLTGDSTKQMFQPNAPLSREALLQWKVPVDLRQTLPTATADSVRQAWGFKDANRIAPEAMQPVLADHQNGDLSNIRRLFGSTLLLQPKKPVTRAEAAAALWYVGVEGDGFSAQDIYKTEQQARSSESPSTPSVTN